MRTTWLGLGWEARSRSRGDPCGDARCRQAAFLEWNYLRGETHHPIPDPISGLGKKRDFAASVPTAPPSLPGWDRYAPATPPGLQGETWVRIKSKTSCSAAGSRLEWLSRPSTGLCRARNCPKAAPRLGFPWRSNAGVGGADPPWSLKFNTQNEFLLKEPPRFCLLGY